MATKPPLVLFNRDLRVHDHPALAAAAKAERTVPLFVFDERLLGSRFAAPNRVAFMLEALHDLDERAAQGGRRGSSCAAATRCAEAIAVARECGADGDRTSAPTGAPTRGARGAAGAGLRGGADRVHAHPGVTVVPPGAVTPTGGDHFKVFTPYHRAWSEATVAAAAGSAAQAARRRQS